jgi:serine/threonine protein kinase
MTRKISKKIIASLAYLKKEELLHCDIKPENILLDTNYNPLLIDFGYSQFFKENCNFQIVHPYYIAPEIKKGK